LPIASGAIYRRLHDPIQRQQDRAAALRRSGAGRRRGRDSRCVRENATWTLEAGTLPISGTWEGRDAIIGDFLATAMAYYEPGSVSLEITAMIAEGDRVALQWTSRARTREGDPYENGCLGLFTVRDGRIQAVREYMDTLYAHDVAFSARVSGA
jgi:ketosteroid isomerase-like protein